MIEELPIEFHNELIYLKEFTTKKDISTFLYELFTSSKFNYNENKNIFKFATSLHKVEAKKIKKLIGTDMRLIDRNIKEWIEESGMLETMLEAKLEEKLKEATEKMLNERKLQGIY